MLLRTYRYSTNNQRRGDTTTFCLHRGSDVDYMELRLWIGLHSCLQCLVLVVSDASYIIKYMTRFTEEGFSSLISFIFISDAIKKMVRNMVLFEMNKHHISFTLSHRHKVFKCTTFKIQYEVL